jgi:endoglucanase
VAWQQYFGASDFPGNMSGIWESHFGYLIQKGFTLAIGEFGGRYVDKDRIWADSLVPYLNGKSMGNFFYWCLNPNSGDTGGILLDDWKSVNEDKMKLIRKLF